MSLDEVVLPGVDEWGTTGGPSYLTDVVRVRSGWEERTGRLDQARHRYQPARKVQTREIMASLLTFFHARKGSQIGFLAKDNNDYTTGVNHVESPGFEDVEIAIAESGTQVYQLYKKYESGGSTTTRKILKPVDGTVRIGIDGVEKTVTTDFTVSDTTGLVTFVPSMSGGESLTAGFEFRVPCRFEKSVEQLFSIINQNPNQLSVRDLSMIELLDEDPVPHDWNPMGDKNHGTATAVSIALTDGLLHVFENTAPATVDLMDATDLPGGGPYFSIKADGSSTVAIRTNGGSPTVDTLASGEHGMVFLGVDSSGVRTWHVLK